MSKRDVIGPRMSSWTLSDEASKVIANGTCKAVELIGNEAAIKEAPVERAPAKRVTFYELPELRRPLHFLDGWGLHELGGSEGVVARYKLSTTHRAGSTWPSDAALLHAAVEKLLGKMGRPPLLVALLRHRYPRSEGSHRGTVEAFHHEVLNRFQELTGARDGDICDLLEQLEKAFVRRLQRSFKD